MASVWGPFNVGLQSIVDFNMGRVVAQLPDGTEVFVIADSTGANLKLYYSTDHVTPNLIATFAIGSSLFSTVALCVDGSGNIYVQYPNGTNSGAVKAFVKGAGYSWTAQTALTIDPSVWSTSSTASSLVWLNTGGGVGGAGHLLCVYRPTASGIPQIGSLDAGVALAGSGTIIAGAFASVPSGLSSSVMDASADGFGATRGLCATHRTSNAPDIFSWQVSATGTVTTAAVANLVAGFSTASSSRGVLLSYAPTAQGWVFLSQSSATTAQVAAATFSFTALTSAAVVVTPTGGDWGSPGTTATWDAFVDPGAPNRVYLLAWASATLNAVRQLGLTCSPLAWDATDTLVDTSVAAPNVATAEYNIRCSNEPLGVLVDLVIGSNTVTPTYQVFGDNLQIEGSVNLPTLVSPTNGTYEDVTAGTPLAWTYNSADGATQAAFAIRYKVAGAAAYLYWNVALSAGQSTPIWNTGTGQTFTLPVAALTNGHIYNWSVSTRSNTRIESGFAADNTLVAAANPSAAVTAPTGSALTSFPVVTWVDTLAPGLSQVSYRIVIYTQAQWNVGGFVAGISPSTWDSGTVVSSATAVTVPVALANSNNYRAYVQVGQFGGELSTFTFTQFSVNVVLPNAPTLTATPTVDGNGTPCIQLVCTDAETFINTWSFEPDLQGWSPAFGSCTLLQSTAQALVGTHSAALTCAIAGTVNALQPTAVEVVAGQTYSFMAQFRAATVARTCQVLVTFQDASGFGLGFYNSTGAADSTSGWTQQVLTMTAPANAAFVQVWVQIAGVALNEVHYVDCVAVVPGTSSTWPSTVSPLFVPTVLSITRGDGTLVRGCPVAITTVGQAVTLYDYEATPNAVQSYKATATVTSAATVSSVTSVPSAAATATLVIAGWWTLDPLNPTTTYSALSVQGKATTRQAQATVHTTLGAPGVVTYPVVVSSGINGQDGSLTVQTQTKAEYDKIETLLQSQTTMWLMSPQGDGMYVRYGPASGGGGSTLHSSSLEVSPVANPVQTLSLTFVGQGRP